MKIKLKEVTINNIKLFFIGYYKQFIAQQYAKYFKAKDITLLMIESAKYSPCVLNGTMKCCGCDTIPKLMAGGKCKYKQCKYDDTGTQEL